MPDEGAHSHPAVEEQIHLALGKLADLELRVRELETAPPPTPTPTPPPVTTYSPLWPVLEAPVILRDAVCSTVAEIKAAASQPGTHIKVQPGHYVGGGILDLPNDTILEGLREGFVWTGSIYSGKDRVIIDNVEVVGVGTGEYDDGVRLNGNNVMLFRATIAKAGDECVDLWECGRAVVQQCRLGFGPRGDKNSPWSLIVGGGRSATVGLYENVFEGGFRNPFVNGPSYVYQALNVHRGWSLSAGGYINNAKAFIERSWFDGTGTSGNRAHEPNASGADDPTVSLLIGSGNHYLIQPRTRNFNPLRVPQPEVVYRPSQPSDEAAKVSVLNNAGRHA